MKKNKWQKKKKSVEDKKYKKNARNVKRQKHNQRYGNR